MKTNILYPNTEPLDLPSQFAIVLLMKLKDFHLSERVAKDKVRANTDILFGILTGYLCLYFFRHFTCHIIIKILEGMYRDKIFGNNFKTEITFNDYN